MLFDILDSGVPVKQSKRPCQANLFQNQTETSLYSQVRISANQRTNSLSFHFDQIPKRPQSYKKSPGIMVIKM